MTANSVQPRQFLRAEGGAEFHWTADLSLDVIMEDRWGMVGVPPSDIAQWVAEAIRRLDALAVARAAAIKTAVESGLDVEMENPAAQALVDFFDPIAKVLGETGWLDVFFEQEPERPKGMDEKEVPDC